MALNLVVFYGSVRSARQGIKVARFIVRKCEERKHQVSLIDPLEFQLPLLDRMYKEYGPGEAPATLQRLADLVVPADAYIVVSGEYNHSVPPALSNLMDHFLDEYFYKPSAIVCYSAGAFGGVRAAVALRPMLAEMGMSSIPSIFPVPKVQDAFDDDGGARDPYYDRKVVDFLDEVEWYATALKVAREKQQECARSSCDARDLVGTAG